MADPDQRESWAEQTVKMPPQGAGFRRGTARVNPRSAHPTEPFPEQLPAPTGWSPAEAPIPAGWSPAEPPRPPIGIRFAQLRRGSGWTGIGALFAFVCWGIWAISARGDLTTPAVTFVLTLLVAAGLFTLARLIGRLVWERQLGRVRRTARGAHLVTGLFLVGVGVAHLRQTEWIVSAWNWVFGQ